MRPATAAGNWTLVQSHQGGESGRWTPCQAASVFETEDDADDVRREDLNSCKITLRIAAGARVQMRAMDPMPSGRPRHLRGERRSPLASSTRGAAVVGAAESTRASAARPCPLDNRAMDPMPSGAGRMISGIAKTTLRRVVHGGPRGARCRFGGQAPGNAGSASCSRCPTATASRTQPLPCPSDDTFGYDGTNQELCQVDKICPHHCVVRTTT